MCEYAVCDLVCGLVCDLVCELITQQTRKATGTLL